VSKWPVHVKGSAAAEEWKQKMDHAKQQRRAQAEAAARAALGPAAAPDQLDEYIREAQRASRQANSAMREQKRQQKIAVTNLRAAAGVASNPNMGTQQTHSYTNAGAPPPPSPRAYEAPPPIQNYAEAPTSRDDLYNHPIFGSVAQPEGVASVAVYRLPSDMPEHRGVTPGYLQSMSFDEFSEDAIRVNHGGGKYRAVAKDSRGRVIRSGDFTISGRAKLFTSTEEELHGGNGQGRITSIFQAEREDVPTQYRMYMEGQDKRMERLEALISSQYASQNAPTSDEDRLNRYKREMDAKEEQEQKRHDRRMQEIKAEMEANSAKEQARLNSTSAASAAAAAQQMEFMKTIVMSQSGVNATLMQALVTKKEESSGAEKFMLPMMQGMGEMMKVQNSNFGQMFSILKDSMGGEDNRTTGTRIVDLLEKGVSAVGEKVGDQFPLFLQFIMDRLGKPKPAAVPQAFPDGSAFQLPDGRVVDPAICAQFVSRYRQLHGVNPSIEVCIAAFVEILNQPAQAKPAQIAGPAAQPQVQITQAQAEEYVRQAQQGAAEEATRAGKTTAEVQAAAGQAGAQALAYLRSLISGQQPQPAQSPAPVEPPAPQAAPTPAVMVAAAQAQAAQPPPAPAPAAVAAAQAVVPVVLPGPVPPQTATVTVQPGPVAAPGSISIPWMHRGFLQYAIDGFQARQNPIDFLFLAVQQGKISPDAKLMIGRIYEDAEDGDELKGILTKVAGLLVERGVVMPGDFLATFGNAPEGESWLETFLFACGCNTREDAMKRLKEEE